VLMRPSVVVGAIYVTLLLFFAIRYHYRAWDFVHMGTVWGAGDSNGSWGYDGQFYYQIAFNPLGAAPYLDNAPYRYRRILYPLVVRTLSVGQPAIMPYTMLGLNLVSIVAGVELLATLLRARGHSPWFGLAYGLYFGQAAALTFDTSEPLAYLLALIGIFLLEGQQRRVVWAAIAFGLAALTRETTLLFPLGYAIFYLFRRDWRKVLPIGIISIFPLAVWVAALTATFGDSGLTFGSPLERLPFYGIFWYAGTPRKFFLLVVLVLLPMVFAWLLTGWELLHHHYHPLLLAWIGNLAVLTFMSHNVYIDLISCGRVSIGLALAGVAYGAVSCRRPVLVACQVYALTFPVYLLGVFLGASSLLL
jgi:hypothetical protein